MPIVKTYLVNGQHVGIAKNAGGGGAKVTEAHAAYQLDPYYAIVNLINVQDDTPFTPEAVRFLNIEQLKKIVKDNLSIVTSFQQGYGIIKDANGNEIMQYDYNYDQFYQSGFASFIVYSSQGDTLYSESDGMIWENLLDQFPVLTSVMGTGLAAVLTDEVVSFEPLMMNYGPDLPYDNILVGLGGGGESSESFDIPEQFYVDDSGNKHNIKSISYSLVNGVLTMNIDYED